MNDIPSLDINNDGLQFDVLIETNANSLDSNSSEQKYDLRAVHVDSSLSFFKEVKIYLLEFKSVTEKGFSYWNDEYVGFIYKDRFESIASLYPKKTFLHVHISIDEDVKVLANKKLF